MELKVVNYRLPKGKVLNNPQYKARGVGRILSQPPVLNGIFQRGSFCTDLFPDTLYRKYIKFAPNRPTQPRPPESLRP